VEDKTAQNTYMGHGWTGTDPWPMWPIQKWPIRPADPWPIDPLPALQQIADIVVDDDNISDDSEIIQISCLS